MAQHELWQKYKIVYKNVVSTHGGGDRESKTPRKNQSSIIHKRTLSDPLSD